MLALTSCAAATPYPIPIASRPSVEPGPNVYTSAPRGAVHSELFACNSWGANIGPVGLRGEATSYTPYIDTQAGALLRNPTEAACLSSGFGWRGAADGGGRAHNGLDLANPGGGFVYAAGDGWVRFADWRGGYGNVLEIDHGNGVTTLYAHLSEIDPNLQRGTLVAAGQPVARMGATGNATGVHLHYEVMIGGLVVDPLTYGAPPRYETVPVTDTAPTEKPEL
jgi:murein DD-endopeptidase MepM/ murein hydrolase activator NlpD